LRSLRETLPLTFAATPNRLTPDAPFSARSQRNLGLPSAQDAGLAIRRSQTVLLSITTVSFTVFTEKSTQNLALANALGP
jgi:hypothetical protein